MFNVANECFVKEIKGDLQPVPSLFETDLLKPLQLVLRKPGWRDIIGKRKYKPSSFHIKDILEGAGPNLQIGETVVTPKFNKKTRYSMNGKFGTTISKQWGVKVKVKGEATIHMDFGKVCKQSVHEPDLQRELSNSKIKLDESFVKNAILEKEVLGVMLAVATLKDGGRVYGERITAVGGDVQFEAPIVDVNTSAGYENQVNNEINLKEDTAIAFSIQELLVNIYSGKVELVAKGNGGWDRKNAGEKRNREFKFLDGPGDDDLIFDSISTDGEEKETTITEEGQKIFGPLHDAPELQFIEWIMAFLSVPRDLVFLSDLLDGEEEEIDQSKHVTLKTLEDNLLSPKDVWLPFLEFTGFQKNGDYLQLSDKTSALLIAVKSMLAALTVLDDTMMGLLREFDPKFSDPLMHMLSSVIQGKPFDNTETTELLDSPTNKSILVELKLSTDDGTLCKPADISPSVHALYWIIYTLYGKA